MKRNKNWGKIKTYCTKQK